MQEGAQGKARGSDARYFVSILSKSRRSIRELQRYDFDLFQPTARISEKEDFVIDGFLTLEQIGRLVVDGYQVLVKSESSKLARARSQTVEFKDWIKEMEK